MTKLTQVLHTPTISHYFYAFLMKKRKKGRGEEWRRAERKSFQETTQLETVQLLQLSGIRCSTVMSLKCGFSTLPLFFSMQILRSIFVVVFLKSLEWWNFPPTTQNCINTTESMKDCNN